MYVLLLVIMPAGETIWIWNIYEVLNCLTKLGESCFEHPELQVPSCSATSANSHSMLWYQLVLLYFHRNKQLEE